MDKSDLKLWFKEGVKLKATHLIICYDSCFGEENEIHVPVFVRSQDDVKEKEKFWNSQLYLKVIAIFNLNLDLEEQLKKDSPFNY